MQEHDEYGLPVERRVDRLAWRLEALDNWRSTVDRDLLLCRKDLDGMLSADAITEAVTAALHHERQQLLSLPQKIAALAVVVLSIASSVVTLVGH